MGLQNLNFMMSVAEIAQLVEQRPEKPCVPSSILGLGTIFLSSIKFCREDKKILRPKTE
jgi:hypothetical protein